MCISLKNVCGLWSFGYLVNIKETEIHIKGLPIEIRAVILLKLHMPNWWSFIKFVSPNHHERIWCSITRANESNCFIKKGVLFGQSSFESTETKRKISRKHRRCPKVCRRLRGSRFRVAYKKPVICRPQLGKFCVAIACVAISRISLNFNRTPLRVKQLIPHWTFCRSDLREWSSYVEVV